jgi:hypothetical protein
MWIPLYCPLTHRPVDDLVQKQQCFGSKNTSLSKGGTTGASDGLLSENLCHGQQDGGASSYLETVSRLWQLSWSLSLPASDKDELRLASQCRVWGANALPGGLLSSAAVSSAELLYPIPVHKLHDPAADPAGDLQVHGCLSDAADSAAEHLQLH